MNISILDNGNGIPAEKIEEIFFPLVSNKDNGTGLGLSVCKTILDEHEAKFSMKNNEVLGTKFEIEFKR